MRLPETIQDEMSGIRELVTKAEVAAEQLADAFDNLQREDDKRMWLELEKRARILLMDIKLAENKRLKPLQAEYAKSWNKKWRF